jgi:hydroxymethylpyrimidine pyrophosphatase-like HAD family hydrolase
MCIDCIMSNMKRKPVNTILSDYDGTLCSTTAVRSNISNDIGKIPQGLEQILFRLSDHIPVCIISSKDFAFLHKRTRFASILSCVLGIETVIHNSHYSSNEIDNSCIRSHDLITSGHLLVDNSKLLHNVLKILRTHNYEDIMIEEKYDSAKEILIGLTIDYRHLQNWQLFKENKEPIIREVIQRTINANLATNSPSKYRPFIQTYSSHPFLDIYGVECNKGLAFDNVLSQLKQEERGTNVMYLGDSENDNPAFRKSDISIGILSDAGLNPTLDCKYMLNFNQLPLFLRGLIDNEFVFSEDLLPVHVD